MNNILIKNYQLLTKHEHKSLLEIRNNDMIRENSLSQNIITMQEHITWLKSIQNDNTKSYFAIFHEEILVGGINIFNKNDNLKWGIFFNNESNLLVKSIVPIYFLEQLFVNLSTPILYSEVLNKNHNALSFNKSLGFKEIEINDDIILLSLNYDTFTKKKKGILLKGIIKKMKSFNFEIKGLL